MLYMCFVGLSYLIHPSTCNISWILLSNQYPRSLLFWLYNNIVKTVLFFTINFVRTLDIWQIKKKRNQENNLTSNSLRLKKEIYIIFVNRVLKNKLQNYKITQKVLSVYREKMSVRKVEYEGINVSLWKWHICMYFSINNLLKRSHWVQ